ncbi:MAG: hypothetical protein AABO57_16275 [Acidobacteriota bacterium]
MPTDYKLTIDSIPPIVVKEGDAATPEDTRNKLFEHNLNVEEHADKFFEMKHKITFFLITAAAGSIAYTLNFAIGRLAEIASFPERKVCLIVAAVAALITVAFSLLSMHYDVGLNALNLSAYFDRKLYTELDPDTQASWESKGKRGADCQVLAFTFLGISIAYQAALFVLFII